MPTVALRPSWPVRPARTAAEQRLADAVATAAASASASLPAPEQQGVFAFPGLPGGDELGDRLWGIARAGAPVFTAEPPDGTPTGGPPPSFDVDQPLDLARSLSQGHLVRAGHAERWLPELGRLHDLIVRGWHSRVTLDLLVWQRASRLSGVGAHSLLVSLVGPVRVEVEGVEVVLAAGSSCGLPPGSTPSLSTEGRGIALQLTLHPFDSAAVVEHFRVMAGHHPLLRANLPVDGRSSPRSYSGSVLDTSTGFADTALEIFDAIDPAEARSWWDAQLVLVPESPPVLHAADWYASLHPVFPAAPAFVADAMLDNEEGVDVVVAVAGFGVPLTYQQLDRLTVLVAGDVPTSDDEQLLEVLVPSGLLRTMA